MMPPSTREVMKSVGSKYAVVVGISKKARAMSEKKELEEKEGHLADMVNHTLEDLIEKKLIIHHAKPIEKEASETTEEPIRDENPEENGQVQMETENEEKIEERE